MYIIWYPLGRFFIEFLRTDSWFFPGTPFNVVHLVSAVAILAAAVILFLRHRTGGTDERRGVIHHALDGEGEVEVSPNSLTTPPLENGQKIEIESNVEIGDANIGKVQAEG